MQREPDPDSDSDFGPNVEYEGFDAPPGAQLGPPTNVTPEFHIFDNPRPDDDPTEIDETPSAAVKRVLDRSGEPTRGAPPKSAPIGAGFELNEKLNAPPFPGHIHVNDLAYILGITPWSIRHLPRSLKSHVSSETAMKEYHRRGEG